MERIQVETSQNVDIQYEIAGIGDRAIAYLIDMLLIFAIVMGISILAGLTADIIGGGGFVGLLVFLIFLPIFFYDLLCEVFMNGQSFGKRIRNIKVIKVDGSKPSFGSFFLRWIFRPIDITMMSGGVGLVSILFSDKGQRVGDLAAETTVVSLKRRNKFDHSPYVYVPDEYQARYPQAAKLSDKDVSIINTVLNNPNYISNLAVVQKLYSQIMAKCEITVDNTEPVEFLRIIAQDYNQLNQEA